MPLYEFECTKCRSNVENSLRTLEKKTDKRTVKGLVEKFDNIHAIEVVDLEREKIVSRARKEGKGFGFQRLLPEGRGRARAFQHAKLQVLGAHIRGRGRKER